MTIARLVPLALALAFPAAAGAQPIDAAVADMCPIRAAVLHEACGAGRARLVVERDAVAELHHAFVGARQRQRQKALRIEYRQRRFRKRLFERGHGNLGGSRAVRMAAHAVHDHDQERLVAGNEIDAILVFCPIARQG